MNFPRPIRMTALLLLLGAAAVADDYPPMDHGGASLTLADGDRIWGEHTGLSRFDVPSTATVTVRPYMPDTPEVQNTGLLIVRADEIHVAGTIDATGAGYTGGGGWGGDKGVAKICDTCPEIVYESATEGPRGQARYGGSEPDGPAKGVNAGQDGGYDSPAANTDTTTEPVVLMGSGGAGGNGGESTPPDPIPWQEGSTSGGGGGGGGPGGGAISLFAETSLIITGQLLTRGEVGENGYHGEEALLADTCDIDDIFNRPCLAHHESEGGTGGSTDAGFQQPRDGLGGRNGDGSLAQSGGAGAGGGIVLYCEVPGGIAALGVMNAFGGRGQTINGGTIKIFYRAPLSIEPGSIFAPRLYLHNLDGMPAGENVMWLLR